jgi:hypothetical protein
MCSFTVVSSQCVSVVDRESDPDPVGSGSGRIRNVLPDPESNPEEIILDPDPGSPYPERI